jgi:signal peptide peptidase SppA
MSENGKYRQIVKTIAETPWAILPSTFATIVEIIEVRLSGEQLTAEEIQERVGARPSRRDAAVAGNVGVLPLYGVITHRADLFSDMSGGTSVQRFQAEFRDMVDDKQVSAIVIDVDSPGGNLDGVPELAGEIRRARGAKPIIAVANTLAASAAYWIASQADEVVVTPSGLVGSIGVFAAHDDISQMQEMLGVKTTLISAGKYKTEANPFEPLSDEARQMIQELVDDGYALFVADVAKGRGVSVDTVRSDFGQGRVLSPKDAMKAGMVDAVETLDAAVIRAARQLPPPSSASTDQAAESGLTFADQAQAARRVALNLVDSARSFARITGVKREQFAEIETAHREVADSIAGLLNECPVEQHELDGSAETELAWTLARLPT